MAKSVRIALTLYGVEMHYAYFDLTPEILRAWKAGLAFCKRSTCTNVTFPIILSFVAPDELCREMWEAAQWQAVPEDADYEDLEEPDGAGTVVEIRAHADPMVNAVLTYADEDDHTQLCETGLKPRAPLLSELATLLRGKK